MDVQHFTPEDPTCVCGAQLDADHPSMCSKCVSRARWTRRHQPRGAHSGADWAIRSPRGRHRRERGGDA